MISDNPSYAFDKMKSKIESIQQDLSDAQELCDFVLSRKAALSDDTYTCLKQDVLSSLKQADDQLNHTLLICNKKP